MKKAGCVGIVLMILAGCRGIQISDNSRASKLTPYITQTDNPSTAEIPATATETVSTPAPTATPIIHVVALGETISSIALHYGVPMDAIIMANPDAKPTVLIVGDELLIPASSSRQAAAIDPAILENTQISDPDCIRTRDGGLWCAVFIENQGQEDLENIVVTFSFRDSDGNVMEERSAPTLMRHAAAGTAIPAVVFLENVPAMYADANASLFSALGVEVSISPYLIVGIEEEIHALNGMEAVISGRMRVEAEQEKDWADIWIGAAAFDADGSLVGVRRLESSVTTNETFNFSITVYSSADSINRVVLYTEAY
jgi:LysM repeat protein